MTSKLFKTWLTQDNHPKNSSLAKSTHWRDQERTNSLPPRVWGGIMDGPFESVHIGR